MAWLMMVPTTSVLAEPTEPPDQVDPPAEGEGEPLEDPSDPAPSSSTSSAAYPSPSVSLSGPTWRRPNVSVLRSRDRYSAAAKASKTGWRRGSRSVVIARGTSFATAVAASPLAGAVNAPLLLAGRERLRSSTRHEVNRLDASRAFLVGKFKGSVERRLERMGLNVRTIAGSSAKMTAKRAAKVAIRKGAHRRTVIVVNPQHWRKSLGVPALAAGRQLPVLLTKSSGTGRTLTRRVRDIGARRTLVIGGTDVIGKGLVDRLPRVRRLKGASPAGTVARVAEKARHMGQRGRPLLASDKNWADATTAGVMAGHRRDGVALTSNGPNLVQPVVRFLDEHGPGRVTRVESKGSIKPIARCQLRTGRSRSWYCAEQALHRQGYSMPQVDGQTDRFSVWAIYAFQKVAGINPDGHFGGAEWRKLLRNPRMRVRRPDLPSEHIEIDISKQLVMLIKNDRVRNVIHTSTGKPSTPMVRGTFTVYEMRNYRQENHMYRSIFFHGGYAIHGYPEIPLYPASHGCARTYDGNQDFIYPKIFIGERVATY